jgi:hypothetical protein
MLYLIAEKTPKSLMPRTLDNAVAKAQKMLNAVSAVQRGAVLANSGGYFQHTGLLLSAQNVRIVREAQVTERARLIPRQCCLFTPEVHDNVQWHSRGKRRNSQGCHLETPTPAVDADARTDRRIPEQARRAMVYLLRHAAGLHADRPELRHPMGR